MADLTFTTVCPKTFLNFQDKITPFLHSADYYPITALGYGLGFKIRYFIDADFAVLQFFDYVEPGLITGVSMRSGLRDDEIDRVMKVVESSGIERLRLVPGQTMDAINRVRNYKFRYLVDDFDYLYETQSLASMVGPALRRRRREIQGLLRRNSRLSVEIKEELSNRDIDEMIKLMEKWEIGRDADAGSDVINISYFLRYQKITNTFTTLIREADLLISFCVFERTANNVGVFHFVKSHPEHRGATSYAIRQSANSLQELGVVFVNFAQDVGNKGLRYYKKSLRPSCMIKKAEVWLDNK